MIGLENQFSVFFLVALKTGLTVYNPKYIKDINIAKLNKSCLMRKNLSYDCEQQMSTRLRHAQSGQCYVIKPVRKEEGKSYWKIPLCNDDATREK